MMNYLTDLNKIIFCWKNDKKSFGGAPGAGGGSRAAFRQVPPHRRALPETNPCDRRPTEQYIELSFPLALVALAR